MIFMVSICSVKFNNVKSGFYEAFNISYIFITVKGIRVKRDR